MHKFNKCMLFIILYCYSFYLYYIFSYFKRILLIYTILLFSLWCFHWFRGPGWYGFSTTIHLFQKLKELNSDLSCCGCSSGCGCGCLLWLSCKLSYGKDNSLCSLEWEWDGMDVRCLCLDSHELHSAMKGQPFWQVLSSHFVKVDAFAG